MESPTTPTRYIRPPVTVMAIRVPKIANRNIVPIFLKRYSFFMLIALSKRMGGSKIIIKIYSKAPSIVRVSSLMPRSLIPRPRSQNGVIVGGCNRGLGVLYLQRCQEWLRVRNSGRTGPSLGSSS